LQGKKMDYQTHNIIIYCDGTLCNNNWIVASEYYTEKTFIAYRPVA
jgi:hypothetical protein